MIQPKISVLSVCYNAVNDIEKMNFSVLNLAETALVRQPYSVAVLSTGGRLHP